MSRSPAVAGQFYEDNPTRLKRSISALFPAKKGKLAAKALIVPHAGHVYSGKVAGETFGRVVIPETVVLLGPNHHGIGAPLAVSSEDWETPLGTVPLAADVAAALLKESNLFVVDDTAHQREHSIEVQLPFLQHRQKNLRIVAISVSHLPFEQCQQAGKALAKAIVQRNGPVLLVASTDMSHYISRWNAAEKDQLALGHILSIDPMGLHRRVLRERITMCGVMPVTIALLAALELGTAEADLVCYTDSGYVSGDTDKVVGYAGVVIR